MTAHIPITPAALPDAVHGLAVSPNFARDGVCFAAGSAALYRSGDHGATWRSCYESLGLDAELTTTAVAVSPAFPSDQMVFAGVNGAVLRSVDGGSTWQVIMLPSPPPLVTALAVSPHFAEDGIVFAGTLEDGIFRSSDRGRSWVAWNFGLLDLNVLALAISPNFAADETLFAGTGSGLFRSTNGGRAWRDIALPLEFTSILSVAFAPRGNDLYTLYAGTEGDGLFLSLDWGNSFTRLGSDVLTGDINSLLVMPQNSVETSLLALLDDMLLISNDGGMSWLEWLDERSGGSIAAIAAAQRGDEHVQLLIAERNGRVYLHTWAPGEGIGVV